MLKIFIAAPISSFDDEREYKQFREKIIQIIARIMELYPGIQIISELMNIQSMTDFETPAISAKKDLENIGDCTHFIIFYPQKIVSSALIELGYALALEKKILIVTPSEDSLPFIARELNQVYNTTKIEYVKDFVKFEEVVLKFLTGFDNDK